MAMAIPAIAEDTTTDKPDYVYVPNVYLNEDGTGTVYVYLNTYVTEYNGFWIDIYLPEGVTINKNKNDKYIFTLNNNEDDGPLYDHMHLSGDNENEDGESFVRVAAVSPTMSYIDPGDHLLLTFKITADPSYTVDKEAQFRNMDFAEGSTLETANDHWLPDTSFMIYPYKIWTGMDNVNVYGEDDDTAVYTLQGVRVDAKNLAPGIYVRAGRKIMVR